MLHIVCLEKNTYWKSQYVVFQLIPYVISNT